MTTTEAMMAYNKGELMINQKTATYEAITNVLSENGVEFEDGQDVSTVLTKEMKTSIYQILISGFTKGEIELKADFDKSKLSTYVSGLVSNWTRKDKRLNGNVQYVIRNPGSRAGSTDGMVKNLRELKKITTNEEDVAKIDAAIEQRLSEIKPTKKVSIDASLLPEELRHLLG